MDHRVERLKSPEACERFAANALRKDRTDLAQEARLKSISLKAEAYGAHTQAEKDALQAVYAYEEVLTQKNGKRTRASRTWQMIDRHGILEAVERAVKRDADAMG